MDRSLTAGRMRPRVLVMADWYLPGYRAGGPIRSVANVAERLEDELDIHIFTTDRDHGCETPYAGIEVDRWVRRSGHHVYYASPASLRWGAILDIIRTLRPDHLYLNSMFSRYMTVYPLAMHRLGLIRCPILLAPRGMLMDSAMAGKTARKRVFIGLLRILGVPRGVRFQATNNLEAVDVRRRFGSGAAVVRIDNLPGLPPPPSPPPHKEVGHLKVVFVGRSHPIKNLDLLLQAMAGVEAAIELTAIVAREDEAYAARCRERAAALPPRHRVTFREGVPHEAVGEILRANHIFALPTKGENFGHAIFEALSAGRPVLISDQTPWRGLEALGAGWDVPVDTPEPFRQQLARIAEMSAEEMGRWCDNAWELAQSHLACADIEKRYTQAFSIG
jgi:glycosyltransferase involved in cell wall biosynthesis